MKSKIYGILFLIIGVVSLYWAFPLLRDIFFLLFGLWSINKALRLLHRPNLYQYSSRMFFDMHKNNF